MKSNGKALLKDSGVRLTHQRTLILEILEKERRHLDAGNSHNSGWYLEPDIVVY